MSTASKLPPAPSEPVTETLHGVRVVDPYRNLEDLKSASTQEWLKAKGKEAATLLARIFTILYFLWFVLMPWYTKRDKTKPEPERTTG